MVSHSSGSSSDRRAGEPGRRPAADGPEPGTAAHAALAVPVAAEPAAMEAEQGLSADGGMAGPWKLAMPDDAAGAGAFADSEAGSSAEAAAGFATGIGTEAGAEAKSAAAAKTPAGAGSEAGAEGVAGAGGVAGTEAETPAKASESEADSAAGAGPEAGAEAKPEAKSAAAAKSPAGAGSEAGAEGVAGAGGGAGTEAETPAKASESEADFAAESRAEGAPEGTPETPIEAAAEALVEAAAVRPNRRAQAARLAFLALTLAAGAYAVARQWGRVREGFEQLGPLPLIIALVPALASVGAMMLAWRGLLGSLGSPLRLRPAARIFFTSQLGKYLPGSVWPVVAQMQLGRAYRIPRARSAAAAALAMLVSLVTALVLAAVTLSVAGGAQAAGYWWAFAVVPVLLAGLHPRVANPVLKTIFRITRRPTIEPLTGETIGKTAGRSLAGWLLAGAHIWVLSIALGADPWRALLLGIGGYAFAWSVGFLIVFAPAGAGVRELILVAALQPVLDSGKATVVALASRLVTIVADLVAAALTAREGGQGPGAGADSDDDGAGAGADDVPETGLPAVSAD